MSREYPECQEEADYWAGEDAKAEWEAQQAEEAAMAAEAEAQAEAEQITQNKEQK